MKQLFIIAILIILLPFLAYTNPIFELNDSIEVIQNNPNLTPIEKELLKDSIINSFFSDTAWFNSLQGLDFGQTDTEFDLLSRKLNVSERMYKLVKLGGDSIMLSINWYNGLPRTGEYFNQEDSLITVTYYDMNVNPPLNGMGCRLPEIRQNEIKFVDPNNCHISIMDVLTGGVVIDTNLSAVIPASVQVVDLGNDNPSPPIPLFSKYEFGYGDWNSVDISGLSSGWYFISISNTSDEIFYHRTFYKE